MLKKIVVSALLAVAFSAHAEDVTLNFVNADVESVIKAVGVISGKNFLIDPKVKGTINIVSSRPIPEAMTYGVLLSALRIQGFAAVESEGVTKIVLESDAKHNGMRTYNGKQIRGGGDRIVTQIYPVQYANATQLVPILRTMITPNNTISAYPGSNTLIITDYADNLKRIDKIIDAMDRPKENEVQIFRLQNMSALDASALITKLLGEETPATPAPAGVVQPGPGAHFSIVPDIRSNSLMVRSDSPDQTKRIKDLLDKLDVPGNGQYGNIHVVYLRNAEAVKLAETLRAIVESKGASAPTAAATASTPGNSAPTAQPVSSIIQADQPTNSLIITAPDNTYNSLRAVIDSLDSRRAQIYVEALIAEVSSDKMAELGIQWQAPLNNGASQALVGGTNFGSGGSNLVNLSTGTVLPGTGLNLGMIKKMMVAGKEVIGISALARALQSDANANILSTPNLLTMDNEEAKIVIGKNVPFITGSYAQSAGTAGSAVNPFQTIERKDVGLTLKVKPQVTEGDTVKLKIYQEASSIQDTSNSAGVITNKRSIESTVLVNDGQIIVLGGLMQDDVEDNVQKVPGVGDLPVLGSLFKYETRKRVKTNLMVFLRPKVMRTAESSQSTTADRYDYIRNEQKENAKQKSTLLPDSQRPLLSGLEPVKPVDAANKTSMANMEPITPMNGDESQK